MAASRRLCDICETREFTVFATHWCPECEQSLCESCKSHHSAFKSSKTHETISSESFDKLPPSVKEIRNDCCEHEARFEYYCSKHEVPCCVECMKTTHAECRLLTPMHKVVEHFKTSNVLPDFEQTISDLISNLNSLIKGRFDNILILTDEKEKCLQDIEDTKRNAIAHLDKLEINLKTEIKVLHGQHLQAINETIKEFELLKTNLAKIKEEAEVTKEYASDFQLFIAFRELESTVKNIETDTHLLIKKESAKQISISFSPTIVHSIETLIPSLGNVNMIAKESDIKLVNHRGRRAQLLSVETPCIDKIQIKMVCKNIELARGNETDRVIYDSCFLSGGRLAFLDKLNKCLNVFNDNGEHVKDLQLPFLPKAIAVISESETAISGCACNKIIIIDIFSHVADLHDHSFVMDGNICALSFRKERFLILVNDIGFFITDIEGNVINEIPYSHTDILCAVLLDDKIYLSNWRENKIVCCDLKGIDILEFRDKELKAPVGITCSDIGVLFITGFKSKNIYAMSSTGKELKQLYSNSKLSRARAISYNSCNQQLLVSTEDGKVFLFDVSLY
ncbi:Hypothetical predicted protein [Mytilus galloprovincialis]|uniref:B box-type domain-containing protein n=1 Tax=Mytilus galloprovincialis TaxID=29158 RepID=A0A8B6HAS2_MYTGA|nr:Hypothetical predicted protein [Mytilus galloprovincialis]